MSEVTLQTIEQDLNGILGNPPKVMPRHAEDLKTILCRETTISLLRSILEDDEKLSKIAARSYTHTLGFHKLCLLDPGLSLEGGARGYGYQLRLHIWPEGASQGVPMVEAMHEHSFDFISHMLTGTMENHRYRFKSLSVEEQRVLERLEDKLKNLRPEHVDYVNRQLEIMEAMRLVALGSKQVENQGLREKFHKANVLQILDITDDELDTIVNLQGRYQAVASENGEGGYAHTLTETVGCHPEDVLTLEAGNTYYHPHWLVHRLYSETDQTHSTILITTPVSQEAQGGSFQRPTYRESDDVNYERQMFTTYELRGILTDYLAVLEQMPEIEPDQRDAPCL